MPADKGLRWLLNNRGPGPKYRAWRKARNRMAKLSRMGNRK